MKILTLVILLQYGLFVHTKTTHIPVFERESKIVSMEEEKAIGSRVTKVEAIDQDGDRVFYYLADQKDAYFRVDRDTGVIRVNKRVDRETLTNDGELKFKVYAAEVDNVERKSPPITITIYVHDINDNKPILNANNDKQLTITEEVAVNTFISKISATDKDADDKDNLEFKIISGNEDGAFKIDRNGGQIRTAKPLDYERKTKYTLRISFSDGGVEHTQTTTLTINVQDEDDNGVAFYKNYTKTLQEGQHNGDILVKVHAEDIDKGINSPVRYSLRAVTPNVFSINEDGYISVHGTVDRETTPKITIFVQAQEVTSKHAAAWSTVSVTVNDVNDNQPRFEKPHYEAHVKEDAVYGIKLLTCKANDRDEGENAHFEYLLDGADNLFTINAYGEIVLRAHLDRETKNMYTFKVLARQHPFTSDAYATVTIFVDDVNDNAPMFDEDIYRVSVIENQPPGTFLTKVRAKDIDLSTVRQRMRYSIPVDVQNSQRCFHVGRFDGSLTTTCRLDRESRDEHVFFIQVEDGEGEQALSSRTKVKVTVLDENDNNPVFEKEKITKVLKYDEPINREVTRVKATDLDADAFGKVSYHLETHSDIFHLDSQTGVIKIAASLARFSGEQLSLSIVARDNNALRPSHHATCLVSVFVATSPSTPRARVQLELGVSMTTVQQNKQIINRQLEDTLQVGIKTDSIDSAASKRTTYSFHAFDLDTGNLIYKDKIVSMLKSHDNILLNNFRRRWNVTTTSTTLDQLPAISAATVARGDKKQDRKEQPVYPIIYAVLGLAGLIAIFAVIVVVVMKKTKKRHVDEHNISLTSSRLPGRGALPSRMDQVWQDDKMESVSEVAEQQAFVPSRPFDPLTDRYEHDPSNFYARNRGGYSKDPFDRIDGRRGSGGSTASSIFAASSVMTVFKAPSSLRHQQLRNDYVRGRAYTACEEEDERSNEEKEPLHCMSLDRRRHHDVIEPSIETCRPPSYDYDLDEKLCDSVEKNDVMMM